MRFPAVKIESFQKFCRSTLRGFCVVCVSEFGVRIYDVSVYQQNRSRWVMLPAEAQLDSTARNLSRGRDGPTNLHARAHVSRRRHTTFILGERGLRPTRPMSDRLRLRRRGGGGVRIPPRRPHQTALPTLGTVELKLAGQSS
jgi:hypothetical protein